MDVHDKLAELRRAVEDARAMPMSASCMVNRAEVLSLIDGVAAALPDDLSKADSLLGDRDTVIDMGRREAERLVERARDEQRRLVSQTEVAKEAEEEAGRILAAAQKQAEDVRAEADDYVDGKLANFEVVLTKTLHAVGRGRERMRGMRSDLEEGLAGLDDLPPLD
jgi:vacuolar-type H+-ATPase subunit H